MPNITLSVNDSNVQALLSRAPGRVSVAMRGAMEDSTTYVLAKIKRYPPQRPGSSYIRTHILEKSWSRRVEGSGSTIRGIVGSNSAMAPYNRIVQDRDRQATIHQGRWNTAQDIVEQSEPRVQRFFEDRLAAVSYE